LIAEKNLLRVTKKAIARIVLRNGETMTVNFQNLRKNEINSQ